MRHKEGDTVESLHLCPHVHFHFVSVCIYIFQSSLYYEEPL